MQCTYIAYGWMDSLLNTRLVGELFCDTNDNAI